MQASKGNTAEAQDETDAKQVAADEDEPVNAATSESVEQVSKLSSSAER